MHQHFCTWKSVFHTTFFGQQWITLPPPPLKPAPPPPFKVLTNPGKPTQICVVIFNLLTLDQQEHLKWKQSLGWRFKFSTKKTADIYSSLVALCLINKISHLFISARCIVLNPSDYVNGTHQEKLHENSKNCLYPFRRDDEINLWN